MPLEGTTNPAKVRQNEDWRIIAETLVRRDAALLTETHRRFREMFAGPLHLPPLPADRLPLSAVVLLDRRSFDEAMTRAGFPSANFVRATWLPGTGGIITYAHDESTQTLDRLVCAGGGVQKVSDQVLVAAAAKQLVREYAVVRGAGGPRGDRVEPPGPLWLSTGLAELLAGIETTSEDPRTLQPGTLAHNRIVLELVFKARQNRDSPERWTIEELLKPVGDERQPTNLRYFDSDGVLSMSGAFECRAWAFCHFLWNYDGGMYRNKFIQFVGRVLDGTGTSEAFAKEIMGRPSLEDWGDFEMEFEWYWSKLLERRVGRDKKTRQWYEPSTEPPNGTVYEDDDFLDVWEEGRAWREQRRK